MAARGQKPVPTALRLLRGNPGKRPLPVDPVVTAKLPTCPAWLGPEARSVWRTLGKQLEASGLIATIDRGTFAAYCVAAGRLAKAEAMIKALTEAGVDADGDTPAIPPASGLIATTPNGLVVKSAWLTISDKAIAQLAKLAPEFGMSPSARTRVAPAMGETAGDEFDREMGMGG